MKGVTVHCKMQCGDKQGGRFLYKEHYWCKHCGCAVPQTNRCVCCSHKLRQKSHYYKRV